LPRTSWRLLQWEGKIAFPSRQKTKVNPKLYVETLLPELVQDCRSVLQSGFIFQQDGAPAHAAKLAQDALLPTAVNSLVKMNGLRTHLTSTVWTTMSMELCLNALCIHSSLMNLFNSLFALFL